MFYRKVWQSLVKNEKLKIHSSESFRHVIVVLLHLKEQLIVKLKENVSVLEGSPSFSVS